MSVDPLAEAMPQWNPYIYTFNNPINFTDPTGMIGEEVIITGDKKEDAFNQLQSSTKLKLSMDDKGKVSASGKAKTASDKLLNEAINSKDVQINVNATDSNYYSENKAILGGVYEGSTIDESGKVMANQTVNPRQMADIDEFYNMPKGSTAKHEVMEGYLGGVESSGLGIPTMEETNEYKGYINAHKGAMKLDKNYVQPDIRQHDSGSFFMYKPNPNPAFKFPKIKELNNLSK